MILQVKDWGIILNLGLEMLNCHTKGLEMLRFRNFLKCLNVSVYACVEDLTNIMSVYECSFSKAKVNNSIYFFW